MDLSFCSEGKLMVNFKGTDILGGRCWNFFTGNFLTVLIDPVSNLSAGWQRQTSKDTDRACK